MESLFKNLSSYLSPLDIGFSPFQIDWYNELVDSKFKLGKYPANTLAILFYTGPDFFDSSLVPWLAHYCQYAESASKYLLPASSSNCYQDEEYFNPPRYLLHPIDECSRHIASSCASIIASSGVSSSSSPSDVVDSIFDFDLDPISRSPHILMQVAAHLSGLAHYYHSRSLASAQLELLHSRLGDEKCMGICVHPELGGWFALRFVLIFRDPPISPPIERKAPVDVFARNPDAAVETIVEFNRNWRANRWRDALWLDGLGGSSSAASASSSSDASPLPAEGAAGDSDSDSARTLRRRRYSPDATAFYNEPNRRERVRLLKRLVDAHLAACADAEHCARRFTPALGNLMSS